MPAPKPASSPPVVRVRYVGPMPEVDVPTLGLENVERGAVVEVSPEAAGQGPHWRPLGDGEQRHVTREYRDVEGVVEVRDLGSGLLSQLGNWELADDDAVDDAPPPAPAAASSSPGSPSSPSSPATSSSTGKRGGDR